MDHGERREGGPRHLMARLSALGVDFQHWCFACGQLNPGGLRLDFEVSRDRAEARYTALQRHQGYDGLLHGGVVTALLDEAMGWAIFHQGIWGVTAKINVSFRQPVPIGEDLRVVGEIARDRGRVIETHGTSDSLARSESNSLARASRRSREIDQMDRATSDSLARSETNSLERVSRRSREIEQVTQ